MQLLVFSALVAIGLAPVQAGQSSGTLPPPGPGYYFVLGRHLESTRRFDEAVAAFKRAIELDPTSADLWAELAAFYARRDDAMAAVENAEKALKLDPENSEANFILGTVYAAFGERRLPIKQGDDPSTYPAKALAAFEKGRGDGPDTGLDLMMGRLYLQTG